MCKDYPKFFLKMHSSAQATITKYHEQGVLNKRNLFLTALDAENLRSNYQTGRVLVKSYLLGLQMAVFSLWHHLAERDREKAL